MKVVCITNDWSCGDPLCPCNNGPHPIKDETYTVIDEKRSFGQLFYHFAEIPGEDEYFNSIYFVPLDDYLSQFDKALEEELKKVKQLELIES